MSNDYCVECGEAFDWDVSPDGCPCCEIVHESPLVQLLTYSEAGSKGFMGYRSLWAVAQWLEAPATAIPHWHVWSYYHDMSIAMGEAMAQAKRGGQWAVIIAEGE